MGELWITSLECSHAGYKLTLHLQSAQSAFFPPLHLYLTPFVTYRSGVRNTQKHVYKGHETRPIRARAAVGLRGSLAHARHGFGIDSYPSTNVSVMLEQLEARAIVWTVAGVYFAATLVLSVITCVIMR